MARDDGIDALIKAMIDSNQKVIESNAKLIEAVMGAKGIRTAGSGGSTRRKARLASMTRFEVISATGWQQDRRSPIYGPGEKFASNRSPKIDSAIRAGHLRVVQ